MVAKASKPDLDLASWVEDTRRLVLRQVGGRIAAVGADAEDVMQDVYVRLLVAQESERSRWDPERGRSRTSYLTMVGTSAASNSLRTHAKWRRREEATDDDQDVADDAHEEGEELGPAMERVLALLDLDEERDMAIHLAAGCSLSEIQTRMGIGEEAATELRTRVRALLLPLRGD